MANPERKPIHECQNPPFIKVGTRNRSTQPKQPQKHIWREAWHIDPRIDDAHATRPPCEIHIEPSETANHNYGTTKCPHSCSGIKGILDPQHSRINQTNTRRIIDHAPQRSPHAKNERGKNPRTRRNMQNASTFNRITQQT